MSDTVLDQREKIYFIYLYTEILIYRDIYKEEKNTGKDGNSNQNNK